MKRFWTTASVEAAQGGYGIALDGRPVRTPGRRLLIVPQARLAAALADEWRAVEGEINPGAMRLTGLANAAIERIAPNPAAFAAPLAAYAESDLLCYRADGPPALVERQAAAWDPLLAWARTRYDVAFVVTSGIIHCPQPPEMLARLAAATAARAPFELAGLAPIVTITGSLVAGLALIEGAASAEAIWRAAQVDEDWQIEKWGDDDIAVQARMAHRAEFDAACRFLSLLD
ncbi:MAG: ATP12 family chaperone protein [Sphingomonas sp.]